MALLVGIATIFSTLLGGMFAIRFKDKLHLILGFSAGAVIGVALFDLLPESIGLATKTYDIQLVTVFIAIGFVAYMILDRFFSLHQHSHCEDEEGCENPNHSGSLGAAALCFHSFLDGLGIGLAFQVSPAVGWIVAAAVLAHDFSDGINTVNMILKEKGNKKTAFRWLVVDALAPITGVIVTLFFTVPEASLGLILAIFTGLFFYIGASDLIPESHHRHPTFLTTVMTILGIVALYIAIRFAS
jgi:ZIP family zinc transporter